MGTENESRLENLSFTHRPDIWGKSNRQLKKLNPHFLIWHLRYSMTSTTIRNRKKGLCLPCQKKYFIYQLGVGKLYTQLRLPLWQSYKYFRLLCLLNGESFYLSHITLWLPGTAENFQAECLIIASKQITLYSTLFLLSHVIEVYWMLKFHW